ncbi:N-acetylmuramoyl-L-alanine amidase family protein [Flavobacterium haoranii]|uniref:N-acetylmuramoyl-L-alanine amidase n=1 Tax=Flavobacterium haoranii TaxID=683124 RepID=A0A1M6HPJ8_9FLAO|nr:N-acetylmuramoyl-L-alanine amidase [Flavobacterium haoranii]MDK2771035.1 N-acetylmuramoyl-L-alanine amidase [Flavobacterium sp.]SHJ24135.1 N-acetylmuramoyl-L-alanine amidase [Flavobacterium haoranii]
MKLKNFSLLLIILSLLQIQNLAYAQKSKFKVVLDAGHGGKDTGKNAHGFLEKNIALEITKKVGNILDREKDVTLVFTRKTDVFVELTERANIANRNDADLFVSIHCNSAGKNFAPYGTETFVMGMSRTNLNFDVAKSENSVIFLEKDYQEKYNGFDPNKPESLIGLKILQEEYLYQSIELASRIESNFTDKLGRKSRGVKQQPLWVLDASYMPSVLIETGFVTNVEEGTYLNSDKGQNEIAQAIADAILSYKKDFFNSTSSTYEEAPKKDASKTEVVNEKTTSEIVSNNKGVIFKVQISASSKKLETKASNFKGLSPIDREQSGKLYKYFYANESSYEQIKNRLEEAKKKGYDSAFIVAYKDGVKISLADALK